MKAVCVLLLLAAVAVFGASAAETSVVEEASMNVAVEESMPQFDAESQVEATEEEVEGETEEESEDEAEADSEEESEQEDEAELSLLEAESEADAENPQAVKIVKPRAPKAMKPFKFHSERIVEARTSKYEDPEMAKLNLALAAVKEDILSTNKQITDERKWVIAVAKIIASYNDKMKRVEAHIIALRKEMKSLYRKKKQIENLKLQRALESKLKEARDELATLSSSLKHVSVKQGELNKSGADLRNTIAGIQAQLAKLRGQQLAKKSRKPKAAVRGAKKARKAAKKGKRCGKGKRFSKKAKKCVAKKAKAGKKL